MRIQRAKPWVSEEEKEAVLRVIASGRFILGDELKGFESEFANYCGVRHAVGVNSGTSALILALRALGIGRGDEVITASNSFMATANAIVLNDAKPVFVDIEPDTFNMDPELVEKAVTDKTRAIMPVHLFGHVCDMDPIKEVAEKCSLSVVEDAAQAHGAEYRGRKTGSLGDAACFSFFPSKNITVFGEGGMIVTDKQEVAEKCLALRNQGRLRSKDDAEVFGFNSRLSEIQAAVGRVQLKRLDRFNDERRRIAAEYGKGLGALDSITLPVQRDYAKHVYHLYTIKARGRDGLKKHLESAGVESSINYSIPIHLQSAFTSMFGFKVGMLPFTEQVAKEVLSIPIFPGMKKEEIDYVIEKIGEFGSK